MLRHWLWQVLFATLALGILGPVAVAALLHWLTVPIDAWLPGALSLYLIPYVGSALVCVWLVLRNWRTSRFSARLLALLLFVLGPFAGIIASMPFVCSIAKECL
jgi:hypothetical protein